MILQNDVFTDKKIVKIQLDLKLETADRQLVG
jgi:hypothetical protein